MVGNTSTKSSINSVFYQVKKIIRIEYRIIKVNTHEHLQLMSQKLGVGAYTETTYVTGTRKMVGTYKELGTYSGHFLII